MQSEHELFKATDLYRANMAATEKVIVNQGGTSSGKTYALDQCMFTHAFEEPRSVCTIAGQDLPNLKVGAIRDAEEIVDNSPVLRSLLKSYNKTEHTYHYKNGSIVEFKAYANAQDAKSGKREYLFVNEANGVKYAVFYELYMRTARKTYIDYNPNEEFWVHEKLIGNKDVKLIISDHRHNPFVLQAIRDKIESIADPELFRVYARGLTGKTEGIIFRNVAIVPDIPAGAKFLGNGLDFGYVNDVTSLIEVWLYRGELYLNELLYETGLVNVMPRDATHIIPNINDRFKEIHKVKLEEANARARQENKNAVPLTSLPFGNIIADSAERKSIDELWACGWKIYPVTKYKGSVKDGIDIMKRYRINITERSTNLRKEFRGYRWATDKRTSLMLNVPIDENNHGIDATRYVAMEELPATVGTGDYKNKFM